MAAKQANSFAALPAGAKIFLLFAGLGVMTAGYYGGFHMALEDETASAQRKHGVLQQQLEDAHERQTEFLKLREELAGREDLDALQDWKDDVRGDVREIQARQASWRAGGADGADHAA